MQQPEEQSSLFQTFSEYRKIAGNEAKEFNDYLLTFFEVKAKPLFLKYFEDNESLGFLGRIANDLTSIHPELTDEMVIYQFTKMADGVEREYKDNDMRRWFYVSTFIIASEFLNQEGKLKKKFLKILVDDIQRPDINAVKAALYGNPENPTKVLEIQSQICATAALALIQVLTNRDEISGNAYYKDRIYGIMDEIGQVTPQTLAKGLDCDKLKTFFKTDFFLSRIEVLLLQKSFLTSVNALIPEPVFPDLDIILNKLIEQLILRAATAGTNEYNHDYKYYSEQFNTYLRMMIIGKETTAELEKFAKEYESNVQKWVYQNLKLTDDLKPVKDADRPSILNSIQTELNIMYEELEKLVKNSPSLS